MIHNIPLRTSRVSFAGRHLGSLDGVDDTMMCSIRFQCSFVSFILIIMHIQHVMSRFFLMFFKLVTIKSELYVITYGYAFSSLMLNFFFEIASNQFGCLFMKILFIHELVIELIISYANYR